MLKTENCFIVVIDVQGNLAKVVAESELANQNVHKLVRGGLELDIPVFLTAQAPEKIGDTTPELREILSDHYQFPRTSFSIWADQSMREALQKISRKQALLCGFESHICLYQSAIDLKRDGYDVWIVADAISSRSLINKELALAELRAEGIHLASVESALFSLLGDASHPSFRTISKIIR